MNSELQIFDYRGLAVRTLEKDNEIWFVAKDVCDILELTNTTEALRSLDDDELSSEILKSGSQGREMRLVSEAGLYALLFRSNKQEAKAFSRWVRHEVLPQIRKIGRYEVHKPTPLSLEDKMNAAAVIFRHAGIQGNQMSLALDKYFKKSTGESALKSSEIQLEAPTQHQLLTPTEIGKRLGISARKVNIILEKMGFQTKTENDKWEPVGLGKKYGIMLDVGKKHSDGTPVRQLKWSSEVLEIMESR